MLQRKKPLSSTFLPKVSSSTFSLHCPSLLGLGKSQRASTPDSSKYRISVLLWNVNKEMTVSKKAGLKKKVIKDMDADITCLLEPHSEFRLSNNHAHHFSLPATKVQRKVNCAVLLKSDLNHRVLLQEVNLLALLLEH